MNDVLLNAKRAAAARYVKRGPRPFRAFGIATHPELNVTGVGIGEKISDGKFTGVDCIRIYVENKVPPELIPPALRLPAAIEGVPTDIIESGRFQIGPSAQAATALVARPVEQTRLRAAPPGCSIGFGAESGVVMAGTLGAIVTDGVNRFILSNNHVLANVDRLPPGSAIFQPGLLDGGKTGTDQIATLTRAIPLDRTQTNHVDCAIAQAIAPTDLTPLFLPKVGHLSTTAAIAPVKNMNVEKVGRTTSYTQGTVFEVQAHISVDYDGLLIDFDDQILVSGVGGAFSAPGDSGSLIVDRDTKRGTALLFAGSPTFTIGNKLSNVLAALGVSLLV